MASGRMYLVDSHSLIFQGFHAISQMSSPDGLPTNAVFAFARDLLTLRQDNPEYLLCAFEAGPTFREEIYPPYKAHRPPMPDDLRLQIDIIREMLDAMCIPVVSRESFEADDIIATLARAGAERGLEVSIYSTDKDCRQLLNGHIRIVNLRKHKVLDRAGLMEEWGITPEQVVDLQALVGDPVDNIPGIPGVGIKTAAKLLQEYGNIDNILKCLDEGKLDGSLSRRNLADKIRMHRDKLLLSRSLARLRTDVPLEFDWEGWKLRDWDGPRLLKLFERLGFRRFADEVRKTLSAPPSSHTLFADWDKESEADPKPRNDGRLHPDQWQACYRLVQTADQFAEFFQILKTQKRLAVDLETTHLQPRQADIVGYAFCWSPGEAWYLPVQGPPGETVLDPETTRNALKDIFENPNIEKINQNIKYDWVVLRQQGVELSGVVGDPMLADYLLHAGDRIHRLDDLSLRYLNHRMIPIAALIGKGKKQISMAEVPLPKIAEYAGEDADVAWRLTALLEAELQKAHLDKLYAELEIPLIEVLADLEFNGVRVDTGLLKKLSAQMAQQLQELEKEIYELAGQEFNIASPQQLRRVLFDDLKLPKQRRTSITGEASTGQETLERLAALGHVLPAKILEHRQIAKLKSTYVDALPALIHPRTGRIHASFNQTVTATGRLSSSDPNLQNIPIRTELGRQIRQAFIPEEGYVLLTADYSQIELRMLAHFSEDPELCRAFAEDRDIHSSVAAQIFGVAEEDVTAEMRRVAKTVNFGVIYGMSAFGLAQRLGIDKEEAARFIDMYFGRYARVLDYQTRLLDDCRKNRYVTTILGRRREISGIRAKSSYQQRNQPEREAINMQIQGSAADLIKLAMLHIYRRLREEKQPARMLLTVHDELVFEVHPDQLEAVASLVDEEMTGAMELRVPLKVDLAAGPNWLDVEEIHVGTCSGGTAKQGTG
ncbi:MAG: DNA polymerase I [Gemmatales bacterium]|nr:MAG: DNA polymerase I [Gemmatales bacterium]